MDNDDRFAGARPTGPAEGNAATGAEESRTRTPSGYARWRRMLYDAQRRRQVSGEEYERMRAEGTLDPEIRYEVIYSRHGE